MRFRGFNITCTPLHCGAQFAGRPGDRLRCQASMRALQELDTIADERAECATDREVAAFIERRLVSSHVMITNILALGLLEHSWAQHLPGCL